MIDKDKPMNGSMVINEEDLKKHSRVMKNMSTNEEVEQSGQKPDPIQFEQEEDHYKEKK